MGLTLALTFMVFPFSRWPRAPVVPGAVPSQCLLVAVDDAATGQVVRAELHNDFVFRQNSDVMLTHFPRNVGKNLVTVGQLHAEHRIRKSFDNRAFDFNDTVFVGHSLISCCNELLHWSCVVVESHKSLFDTKALS